MARKPRIGLALGSGSARGWADKTIGKHLRFNAANTEIVYQLIDLLDQQVALATPHAGAAPSQRALSVSDGSSANDSAQ